jgi:cardiolipin synthase A/B
MTLISNLFKNTKEDTSLTHTWSIFTGTKETLDNIYAMCESAKESIYLETYILYPDAIGEKFLELFARKSKEGVDIKILVDSVGSLALGKSAYLDHLKETGVKIKFFNWILPFSKQSKKLWYFRNHRRMVVVDRKILFTGGFCIQKKMEDWRDTTLKIEGPKNDT